MVHPTQNPALLQQMAGGFAPIASGLTHQQLTGFEGVPFMDQGGMMGMAMQAFVAPQLQQMMMSRGMMPMGMHDQNVYDVMRNMEFTRAQQEAMAQAAEMDTAGYMRTFRGIAAMSGTPWGTQQRRAARSLADTATAYSPMLAQMFPDFLDEMGGMRGSATVMAQRMMLGSRYRLDPVTGRMGQDADTVGQQAQAIFRDLYEGGDISQMRGITAGQLGTMYDEMGRRGMLSGMGDRPIGARTMDTVRGLARDDLEDVAKRQGVTLPANLSNLSADDLDKLRLDPQIADRMRSVDTEGVKRSLKSYVDAISAVRDIFGDLGQPNAPMQQLMQSLEALTQGGVSQFDPGRLNMMVRTTHELAQQSGMTLDAAVALQQHGAGRLEQLGMSRLHAPQVAQGSMAWGGAARAMGMNATPAWGRMDANAMQQLDTNLRAQAVASEQANRMGLLMRIRDRIGGFEEGSQAEAMAQAVMAGQTQYINPATGEAEGLRMTSGQFADVLNTARGVGGERLGLNMGDITSMLGQRRANEEFINRYDIGNIVRRQMPEDMQQWVGRRFGEQLENRLIGQGMSREDARRAASQASDRIAERVMGLSNRDFADAGRRTTRMADIIQEELGMTDAGQFLADKGVGEDFYELTAEQTYGYTNRLVRKGQFAGFESLQNVHAMMNEDVLRQGENNRTQARIEAMTQDALSPLGRGTLLQRAVQYLQDARPGDDADLPGLVMTALGGVKTDDIQKGLQTPLIQMRDQLEELETLKEKYANATTDQGKAKALKDIEEQIRTIRESSTSLTNTAEEFGIFTDQDALTGEDTERTRRSMRLMIESTQDLHGLRGGFGHEVSEEEAQGIVGQKFSDRDVGLNALIMRRQKDAETVTEDQVRAYAEAGGFIDKGADLATIEPSLRRDIEADIRAQQMDAAGMVTEADLQGFMDTATINEEEAADVVRMRRARISLTPPEDEVQKLMDEQGMDRRTAIYEATQNRRAARLGISQDEVAAAYEELGEGATTTAAVDLAFQKRYEQQYDVSEEDIDELIANPRYAHLVGATREQQERQVLANREAENRDRWGEFWNSESGAQYRESVDNAMMDIEDLGTRAIMSDKMMRRLGPAAIREYENIRSGQQRLRTLALYHTGGDIARLQAGDFDIDTSTPEGQKLAEEVRRETFGIQRQQLEAARFFEDSIGKQGRQFGDIDRAAMDLVGISDAEYEALSDDERKKVDENLARVREDVAIVEQLSDADVQKIEDYQKGLEDIDAQAKRYGVTTGEMTAFIMEGTPPEGKPDALMPLTADQSKKVRETKQEYDRLSREEDKVRLRLSNINNELQRDDVPADRKTRLQEEKAQLEARHKQITDEGNKVLSGLDTIAASRGVSSAELMRGKGHMSEKAAQNMRERIEGNAALRADLETMATRVDEALGADVDFDEMLGSVGVLKQIDDLGDEYRRMEQQGTPGLVRDMMTQYGFDADANKDLVTRLQQEVGSEAGRGFLRRIMGSSEQLKGVAARGYKSAQDSGDKELASRLLATKDDPLRGVVAMADEYYEIDSLNDAEERRKRMGEFKQRYGFAEGESMEFDQFRSDMQFQKYVGMLDVADATQGKKGRRMEMLERAMQTMMRGGEYDQDARGASGREEITLRGELDVNLQTGKGSVNALGDRSK